MLLVSASLRLCLPSFIPGADLYGDADDWMPLSESSWNPQDSHDLADFLSFHSPASARLSELPENPADFEYRAPDSCST